jgi:hypothetical protein
MVRKKKARNNFLILSNVLKRPIKIDVINLKENEI